MTRFVIGIDTGGTYTDAVVVDAGARRVLAKRKALTTKGDLAVGVGEALGGVLASLAGERAGIAGADVSLVSLSTTLATNAIVEGHGAPVGVVLIGFDDAMAARTEVAAAMPDARILRVAGGHDHGGGAREPLDADAIARFVADGGGTLQAYAVAAHYSVRNPAHEHQARDLLERLTGRPVTISSDLAHALDAPRRALTAALNARIVGRIVALIEAVRRAMAAHGIAAPLMIVKGDGTLGAADAVARRPIETILSGPAASVIGAKFLSGLTDFVISDMGGTTTDVAMVEKGWPRLDRSGAQVGGRRTLVRAIDMRTFGLGGDSQVAVDAHGAVAIRPHRITPLSLLGDRHPGVIRSLEAMLAEPEGAPHGGRFALRPFGHGGPAAAPAEALAGLSPTERDILARVGDAPTPLAQVIRGPSQTRMLMRLVGRGLLALGGFTPSDAAHVLGLQAQWSAEAARLGALLLAGRQRMTGPRSRAQEDEDALRFAREVVDATVTASGRVLVEALAGGPLGDDARPLVDAAVSGRGRWGELRVSLRPAAPLVAVGGPAAIYYPELARRLGCEVVLPPDGDVANAIGAAVGVVKVQVVVEITSPESGLYRIHHDGPPLLLRDPTAALDAARAMAGRAARDRAMAQGGTDPTVEIHVDRVDLPGVPGDAALAAATVIAECWGAPA